MTAPRFEAPSPCVVGLHGAGHMGSGLGWALREGGARVITSLGGRSERTRRLVQDAGIEVVPDLSTMVETATHILVVTPPGAALRAARALAETASLTDARPLVADMNAIAPTTVSRIAEILSTVDVDLVDGSISGGPPTVSPGARLYFAGDRAAEMAGLPWRHVRPIDLGRPLGSASALKMSTASVYKGLVGLYTQAIRSADHYGVLHPVLADLRDSGFDHVFAAANAAAKAERYVPEMENIAAAQQAAGLTPALFTAFAEVYAEVAKTALAHADPESVRRDIDVAEVLAGLRTAFSADDEANII